MRAGIPIDLPDKQENVYTVTVLVRVRGRTPEEARRKILSRFPLSAWPRGSVSIKRLRRGWFNR